jgi:hypothetical protein
MLSMAAGSRLLKSRCGIACSEDSKPSSKTECIFNIRVPALVQAERVRFDPLEVLGFFGVRSQLAHPPDRDLRRKFRDFRSGSSAESDFWLWFWISSRVVPLSTERNRSRIQFQPDCVRIVDSYHDFHLRLSRVSGTVGWAEADARIGRWGVAIGAHKFTRGCNRLFPQIVICQKFSGSLAPVILSRNGIRSTSPEFFTPSLSPWLGLNTGP